MSDDETKKPRKDTGACAVLVEYITNTQTRIKSRVEAADAAEVQANGYRREATALRADVDAALKALAAVDPEHPLLKPTE